MTNTLGRTGQRATKAVLNEASEKRLRLYAVEASAAAALLAPQAANAEVIFIPANVSLHQGSTFPIDIGGTTEFTLTDRFYIITGSFSTALLQVTAGAGASVVGHQSSAAPLRAGALIGPAEHFQAGKVLMAGAFRETQISSSVVFGPFANKSNRYLGLKFTLQGQTHFGWVRFSVVKASANGPQVTAVLKGIAYETVADQPIHAGQIDAASDANSVNRSLQGSESAQSASLGLLALGLQGMEVWRRKLPSMEPLTQAEP